MKKSRALIFCILFALMSVSVSAEALPKPDFFGYVYDYANVIDTSDEYLIDKYAEIVDRSETATVIVVTVETLNDMDSEEYASEIFNTWGIGRQPVDDGVLILLAPNERKIQITTGNGIAAKISGDECGRIIDEFSIEKLSVNRFSEGMKELTKAMCIKVMLVNSALFDDMDLVEQVNRIGEK